MKVGQRLRIVNSGGKGRIAIINDKIIGIDWARHDADGAYDEYELSHIEGLVKIGTLELYNELPPKNPNLLFKGRK